MQHIDDKISILKGSLAEFKNFPKQGILFRDLNPLYKNKHMLKLLMEVMAEKVKKLGTFDYIAGIEARGFILGAALAREIDCGFIPVRKKGKLPGKTKILEYALEYGTDTIEIQEDKTLNNSRILIVDDVYATGGTMKAAIELIGQVSSVKPNILVALDIEISNIKDLNIPYAVALK